ncbi:hypothetical protein K788_00037300 (plasmid) [Paraburkholderia caribensis MBA4]|jgi:hypothetical protein|uniref:Uncharacterized protein n=2 Tax=Paraburkholderia TaxID=1822464 RepID=A0A7I8BYW1_9BURK|nr:MULTISPECIES: hypothetical protein [Paraburkholderia]ALL69838.1 hypothetical protein K788_00037300 [Paraburkholderia caribensis MBA4]BCF93922.1 hypothetical protein PPGU16_69890 [Paraburkholderia sp. PGU16]
MSTQQSDDVYIDDKFAVAEVVFYMLSVLQIISALMMATGSLPINLAQSATTMQRAAVTLAAVVNILCFAVAYVMVARYLKRCTSLVWRIALALLLMNLGLNAVLVVVQPGPGPVLICCLSVAGIGSLWNRRKAVKP